MLRLETDHPWHAPLIQERPMDQPGRAQSRRNRVSGGCGVSAETAPAPDNRAFTSSRVATIRLLTESQAGKKAWPRACLKRLSMAICA